MEFASVFVDYKNKRVFELVRGKAGHEIKPQLQHIPGRENVRKAIIDLCDPFKNFVQDFFPNAELIADKFHVLRLLTPSLNKRRKEITGDRRSLPIRKLLLRNGHRLEFFQRSALHRWLEQYPLLKELYQWKERLHGFYRIRGYNRASQALTFMTDQMANSQLPEIKTLRKTLMKWRLPILAYFKYGLTNGRTEGFNNKAKLVKRMAYGYKNFENYRLRVLNACA
jgi:transposase